MKPQTKIFPSFEKNLEATLTYLPVLGGEYSTNWKVNIAVINPLKACHLIKEAKVGRFLPVAKAVVSNSCILLLVANLICISIFVISILTKEKL